MPATPSASLAAPLGLLLLMSVAATRLVLTYATRRMLDIPNDRSSHSRPTPRGGGLAIVICFALAIAYAVAREWLAPAYAMALAGALPIAAVGLLDDHGHVPARWRLAVQAAAAAWALAWLGGFDSAELAGQRLPLGLLGNVLAVLFILWLVNLFNFMDGIDGLAGSEAVCAASGAGLLLAGSGLAAPWWFLAAASAGFLVWNWPPARIFMGDVGSASIGFLLAVMALHEAAAGLLSLAAWHILAAVFYVDATLTLLRRMASGQRWTEAHRSHAYQHAAARYGHRPVTLAVAAIDMAWLLPLAAAATAWPRLEPVLLAVAYGPLVVLALRLDAGKA